MGNRAIIKFTESNAGIYLHWNGGRDSVEAFLEYCRLRGFRSGDYGIARMSQVIGNFFGGDLSLGIVTDITMTDDCSPGDNGIYLVEKWQIIGRYPEPTREQNEYDRTEMLLSIDEAQPQRDQLGKDLITAPVVKTEELKPGDRVYLDVYGGGYKAFTVLGFRTGYVNGTRCDHTPYVDFGADPEKNINAMLRRPEYRLCQVPEAPEAPEAEAAPSAASPAASAPLALVKPSAASQADPAEQAEEPSAAPMSFEQFMQLFRSGR